MESSEEQAYSHAELDDIVQIQRCPRLLNRERRQIADTRNGRW